MTASRGVSVIAELLVKNIIDTIQTLLNKKKSLQSKLQAILVSFNYSKQRSRFFLRLCNFLSPVLARHISFRP